MLPGKIDGVINPIHTANEILKATYNLLFILRST